jgi:hypothetical protein
LEQIKTLNEKYLVKEEKELKESNETQAMNNQNASK